MWFGSPEGSSVLRVIVTGCNYSTLNILRVSDTTLTVLPSKGI